MRYAVGVMGVNGGGFVGRKWLSWISLNCRKASFKADEQMDLGWEVTYGGFYKLMNLLSADRRMCLLQLVMNKGVISYLFVIHSPHQHRPNNGGEGKWQANMIVNFWDKSISLNCTQMYFQCAFVYPVSANETLLVNAGF